MRRKNRWELVGPDAQQWRKGQAKTATAVLATLFRIRIEGTAASAVHCAISPSLHFRGGAYSRAERNSTEFVGHSGEKAPPLRRGSTRCQKGTVNKQAELLTIQGELSSLNSVSPLQPNDAVRILIDSTPKARELINAFSKSVLSIRGGRVGSGMGTLLEALWGFYMNEVLKEAGVPVEIGWLSDQEYNDFACIVRDAPWKPTTREGELLRIEAKSMNSSADESKRHFDELQRNLGKSDLLLVLVWAWEPLDAVRVFARIQDSYIGLAINIANLRDALHVARGGTFVTDKQCPDGCRPLPCRHAGEPLNANGKRERLSGPNSRRVSNSVSYAANFGGLVRMMKTNSEAARDVFRRLRAEDEAAHDYISFLHRNFPDEEESSYLRADWVKIANQIGIQAGPGVAIENVVRQIRNADANYMNRLRGLAHRNG